MLERLSIALVPVTDEIGVEHAAPRHAALQEAEAQLGEAPGHAAEEDRLADRVAGGGEVADVVVREVRRRQPQPLAAHPGVEGRRDAVLRARLPERIVVVRAVEAERVVPDGEARSLGGGAGGACHRPRHQAAEHRDLEAELARAVLELGDRLLRRVGGDAGGRRDAVAEVAEVLSGEGVERAAGGPPRLVVGDARHPQPHRGIEDRKVDPELVQPLVEQPR